jgi:hypothetical protein
MGHAAAIREPIPPWTNVLKELAPLPVENITYVLYESVPEFWNDPTPKTFPDFATSPAVSRLLL